MSIFQLTPLRVPNKGQKTTASPKTRKVEDLRHFVSQMRLGPLAAKVAIVLAFTFCWLLVVLVRSHGQVDPAALENSSLIGLAAAMKQGLISGRDFQSAYGPAAQLIAWTATTFATTRSALDGLGLIIFWFYASSAVLTALTFLLCDRISWQQAAVFYGFFVFLNLFSGVADMRAALLMLNAVFAYKTIASYRLGERTAWAIATGLLCFLSQLVTFELGLCAAVAVACGLIAGAVLMRDTEVLHGLGSFIATLAVSNLALVTFFALSSSSNTMVFDYPNYALEMLRGSRNTMGVLWELPTAQTLVLIAASLYVVVMCVMAALKSDPLDASLLATLGVAGIIWLITALVRSDIAHIAVAFTPMVMILSLLIPKNWRETKEAVPWAVIVSCVVVAWPLSGFTVPKDLAKIIRGEVGAGSAMRDLHVARRPLDKTMQASLATPDQADRRNVPLLAFPYETHISVGLRRPLVAPVLETQGTSTRSLEDYYIRALENRRRAGLEIVYGLDRTDDPLTAGVQAITRTPEIFEYIYKNFAIATNDQHADGHYVLRPAHEPRQVTAEPLRFSTIQQSLDAGLVKLDVPSACGLVRVEMRLRYTRRLRIFRPSGAEVSLSNGDERVWQGFIRPLEPNQTFVTYISPLPPEAFHKVFGHEAIPGVRWDKFEYRSSPADMLGAKATRVELFSLQCLDPEKFTDPTPSLQGPLAFRFN